MLSTKPKIRKLVITGSCIIGIYFLGFGFWAVYAKIHSAVVAPGIIVVEHHKKAIRHLEGGIISQLLVNEDSNVKPGMPLVKLDDTKARTNLNAITVELHTMLAKEARLHAENNNQQQITFPKSLVANQNHLDKTIMATQTEIFAFNKQAINKELVIYDQQIASLDREIGALNKQISAEQEQLAYAQQDMAAADLLQAKDLIAKRRSWLLHKEYSRIQAAIDKSQSEASYAEHQQALVAMNKIKTIHNRKINILTELKETKRKVNILQERFTAAKDILDRTVITATTPGRVINLQYHHRGAVIQAGAPIMEIVPDNEPLLIEAQIRPVDIDAVHVGMHSIVKLTAYNNRYLPLLNATVQHISADIVTDISKQQPYYKLTMALDKDTQVSKEDISIYPGMPVQVMIITGHKSFFNYLLTPIANSLERAFRES